MDILNYVQKKSLDLKLKLMNSPLLLQAYLHSPTRTGRYSPQYKPYVEKNNFLIAGDTTTPDKKCKHPLHGYV
jgi:hypothetical protein